MKKLVLLKENKKIILLFKTSICIFICLYFICNAFLSGLNPYYANRNYNIQNEIIDDSMIVIQGVSGISQNFQAKGNILSKLNLYFTGDISYGDTFNITLNDSNDKLIFERTYSFSDYISGEWNEVDISVYNLIRNQWYSIIFTTDNDSILLYMSDLDHNSNNVYGNCIVGDVEKSGFVSIGFQFIYKYIVPANIMFFVFRLLIVILLSIILCYGIFNLETIYSCYVENRSKIGILYGLYFSVYVIFLFDPMEQLRTTVTAYTREMGVGLLANYDISRVIENFFRWFILFAILFVMYFLISNFFLVQERNEEQHKIISFLNKVIVLANTNLLLRAITFFYDEEHFDVSFYYSSFILISIIIFALIYIVFNLDRYITSKSYYQIMLSVFGFSFPFAVLMGTEWESGKLILGIQIILALVSLIIIRIFWAFLKRAENNKILHILVIISTVFPFFTSFYIELINILNQYGIFVANPRKSYGMACLLIVIASIMIGIWAIKRRWKMKWWKVWSHVWIIVGSVCLYQQIPLQNLYNPDIFESANHGVLINGFLKFGQIPIVEQLGHHMMLSVWEGLAYALLNNDYTGAIISPYAGYLMIPSVVLFYFFIKEIWDEDVALWVALLFPLYDYWSQWGYGMLIAFSLMAFAKKNTYGRAVCLWLSCVWCVLWRIDVGYAFSISCVLTLAIYIISVKKWEMARILLYTLMSISILGIAVWNILCFLKGIHPVKRLIEFFKLFNASINWAYKGIGNNANTIYAWAYLIVPFATIVALIYIIFSGKFRKSIEENRWLLLLVLGFSYFANFSRALTRHSLLEMSIGMVFWTANIFLALFIACLIKKRDLFLPVFVCFILLNTLFLTATNFTSQSIADVAVEKAGAHTGNWVLDRFAEEDYSYKNEEDEPNAKTYWEKIRMNEEIKDRVIYTDAFEKTIIPYRVLFDLLLDEDDTFFDFIYVSYLYAECNRFDPVYMAQSPTMLSGELAQEYCIEEIEDNIENIPIVLMPNNSMFHSSMDGISLNYKYYKVAEFIYANYRPLCEFGDFSIWCLNERYMEMVEKLRIHYDEMIDALNAQYNKSVRKLNDYYGNEISEELYEFSDRDVLKQLRNMDIKTNDCSVDWQNKHMNLVSIGKDPYMDELQNYINLREYNGKQIRIDVEYASTKDGIMQLFYTTSQNESYSEGKSIRVWIGDKGTAHFNILVTPYTRLRLDIPEESTVKISDIRLSLFGFADWGYDSGLHSHSLNQLPLIWAELDEKEAINNRVMVEMIKNDEEVYTFDTSKAIDDKNGNYLMLTAAYAGLDTDGLSNPDDEYISGTVMIGSYDGNLFAEKCRYNFTLKEGEHSYLFRVSSDYFWTLGEINAVKIVTSEKIEGVQFKILQGD